MNMLTKEDIQKLSLHDPIINKCMQLHKHVGISYEQALMVMVKELSARNKELFNKVVKYEQSRTV